MDKTGTDGKTTVDFGALDRAGLNLQAIFDLDALPSELRRGIDPAQRYRQLLLIGHGGRTLWENVRAAGGQSEHPIDDFSVITVAEWLAAQLPGHEYALIYPGDGPIALQQLGRLAGWHHDTPFRVGINATWGTWFAYRVAVLMPTRLAPTAPMVGAPPCATCAESPCIAACPGAALAPEFSLQKCIAYRQRPESRCMLTCVARTSCPVRPEHRYTDAQIAHSYVRSLRLMRSG